MVVIKAKIDFSKYEMDDLDEKASTIQSQLNTNIADFPGLPLTPAQLLVLIVALRTVLDSPVYPEKTADTKKALKDLRSALRKLGNKVNEIADGDLVLLAKSGFPTTEPHLPVGQLDKASFKNIVSIPGGFEIDLNKLLHAKGYMVCLLPTIDLLNGSKAIANKFGKWPWYHSTNTKLRITDLDNSVKYTIVAVGVGTDKTLTFSDPIERTTQ
jgi:hypothetical protein